MSEKKVTFLLYQKDFSEKGHDRYFIYDGVEFSEKNSDQIVKLDGFIVTHDYWLISTSLYKKHKELPSNVIDVVLLAKIVEGKKSASSDTQVWDVSKTLERFYIKKLEDLHLYFDMYYRRKDLNTDTYMLFSHKLAEYFSILTNKADEVGELNRFYDLEVPIFDLLTLSVCKGLRVNADIIKGHKDNLHLDFYRKLKFFAEKHNVMYEIPNDAEVKEKLIKLGYKVEGLGLDFLIDFLPSKTGYTEDLKSLQKINKSLRVFNSISENPYQGRIYPLLDSHATSTSRIYFKTPSVQNISKKYRNIFIAEEGKKLCYIDYDQFEVGIMAALTSDPKMLELYNNRDAYSFLASEIFNNKAMRNKAKKIFLSYTYGMTLENIITSVESSGGIPAKARQFFSEFKEFEHWKKKIHQEFYDNGKVHTIEGNSLNRTFSGDLRDKEKRTSVNHVIQGSASYIFKKAILEVSRIKDVQVLIPMHDAVLIQYTSSVNPSSIVEIFKSVMSELLGKKVVGQASIEEFYSQKPQ